jgi:hypothetical protein
LGTKEKKIKSHPPKLKRKKIETLGVLAEPFHWLHEISISKTVITIFGLG